jgi:hypothetical protein
MRTNLTWTATIVSKIRTKCQGTVGRTGYILFSCSPLLHSVPGIIILSMARESFKFCSSNFTLILPNTEQPSFHSDKSRLKGNMIGTDISRTSTAF